MAPGPQGMMPPQGAPQMPQGPQGGMPQMQANTPQGPPPGMVPPTPQQDPNAALDGKILSTNIAERIKAQDPEKYKKIGHEAKRGYDNDDKSRDMWLRSTLEWLKLAKQTLEKKTYPWPDASNIKYPLISTAALQFSARAYPSLVPADKALVNTRVYGMDQDGQKAVRGDRVAKYMSWQFMEDMTYWEEDTDKLLISLAVCGMMFRKTFYNTITDKIDSVLVYPENFVIDYYAKSIEKASRYSEAMEMTAREIEERIANEDYCEIKLGSPQQKQDHKRDLQVPTVLDWTTPFRVIEQHTWLDLDDDKVKEPYIVTFLHDTGEVLRITAKFTQNDVIMKGKKVVGYKPCCPYTKYGFIPNPDGSFYDLGFGHLLGPLNASANTLLNLLVDAGHLSNLQSGFIGKGLRIKMGQTTFTPGEWKAVNATGDDLRKQIVPLPAPGPSEVLFKLLDLILQSGKELASVAEIFVGKMPGQNTPATTTQTAVEQGMKVFTSIYKRIYRSLDKEFKKVFHLNRLYMDPNTYSKVVDASIGPDDFNEDHYDICPSADPTSTSQQEKLQKAQALMQLMQTGLLDNMKVVMRVLDAQEQPDWQDLIPGLKQTGQPQPPPPPPDPKVLAIQAKSQADQQTAQLRMAEGQHKMALEDQQNKMDLAQKQAEIQLEQQAGEAARVSQANSAQLKSAIEIAATRQKLAQAQVTHVQKLSHAEQMAKAKQEALRKQHAKSSQNGKRQG